MSALKVAPEITSTGRSHQSMVFFFTFTVQKTRRATRKDSSGGRQVQGTCFYGKRYSSTFICTAFFRSKPYPEQVLFIAGPKGACLSAGRPWLTGAQEDLRNGSLAERRSPFANTVTAVTVRWQIPTLLRALPHPRCPNFQRIKRFVNDSVSAVAIPLALSLPLTTFEARADDKKR